MCFQTPFILTPKESIRCPIKTTKTETTVELVLTRKAVNKDESRPGDLKVTGTDGTVKTFPTIEGKNRPWLRKGEYEFYMDNKRTGQAAKCLRSKKWFLAPFLIHKTFGKEDGAALEGCIGPGLSRNTKGGVKQSAEAMDQIFKMLGGFPKKIDKDNLIKFKVTNNVPGGSGTQTSFEKRQEAKMLAKYGKGK